ncbi:hypothetical protein VroAM7_49420 (plasmid) [Vibrio rotiferianus]|uniref:Conjugal transfer protein TraB n=1 Tax=Vibrio rotiferianus TaxID=190895 RepID=A0A510IEZ6_9VIBR|nr:TraB/VirB10 family protein [Vibrio rotiferianus]BBL92289.1 hypothetical protein VroAM7_49420 [Vibrio rotiferianus]
MSLKEKYNQLDNKSRTYVLWGGIGMGILAVLFLLKPEKEEVVQPVQQNLEVTPFMASADDVDIESLNVRQQSTERDVRNIQAGVTQVNKKLTEIESMLSSEDRLQTAPEILYELQRKNNQRDQQIEELRQLIVEQQSVVVVPETTVVTDTDLEADSLDFIDETDAATEDDSDTFNFDQSPGQNQPTLHDNQSAYSNLPTDPLELLRQSHKEAETSDSLSNDNMYITDEPEPPYSNNGFENGQVQPTKRTISIIQSSKPPAPKKSNEPEFVGKRINAGSLVPLTLLTGVDAPTGKRAADKLTATFVITGEARLPDGTELNLDPCRVLSDVQAHKTEARAYFRPYKLSCKFEFGDLDMPLTGSISGPDGALGIKGHLVNPAGKAVLFSTMTSGIDLAAAWLDSEIDTIELAGGDTLNSGGGAVASSTAPLREYYLEEAKELQPYVQVRPLVRASMVVLDTLTLELLEKAQKGKG